MSRYHLNKHFAATLAGALTLVGGLGYAGYGLLTAPDSPETAEERRQSTILRGEIITYLPLTREMTIAAPPYEYPPSDKGDLDETFDTADEIIENANGIGNIDTRCEVLSYLRAVHRRAAENYLASDPALPLPNLQTHIAAAQRPAPDVPLCQKK